MLATTGSLHPSPSLNPPVTFSDATPGIPTGAFLALADISGYTRYMLANRRAFVHGQGLVAELKGVLLKEVPSPLRVNKVEGDCIFMAAPQGAWHGPLGLRRLVDAFDHKLQELIESNSCPCEACRNLERLRLKVLAHSGSVLHYAEEGREELSGADVVLLYRLLKNDIQARSYILLTHQALQALGGEAGDLYEDVELGYPDLGVVRAHLQVLDRTPDPRRNHSGWLPRFLMMLRKTKWDFRFHGRLPE